MKDLAVVYWSGTGNTEAMANAIIEGFKENNESCDLIFSDDFTKDDVDKYKYIAFGCPAMGDEVLEESSFDPMFTSCEEKLKDKQIAIFGSYEWNNGEWMDDWKVRCDNIGAILVAKPLIAYDYPDDEKVEECKNLGREFSKLD